MYFDQKSINSYFQTELEGKTLFIWNNICSIVKNTNF